MDTGLFTAEWLRPANNRGYGKLPIPQRVDLQIAELLCQFRKLDDASRRCELEKVRDEDRDVYLAYSERMASLAVRRSDRDLIVLGLIASGLDGWRIDHRENLMVLPLHYDAATQCGLIPDDIFNEAAAFLTERPADGLRSFPRRSPHDRSLAAFFYVIDADGDGFRYKYKNAG